MNLKEKFDTQEEMEEKAQNFASLVQRSRNFVVFTGAGISTSAGIPDYRSPVSTVLKTGPGQWQAGKGSEKMSLEQFTNQPSQYNRVETVKAEPTFAHMAISKLVDIDVVQMIIS